VPALGLVFQLEPFAANIEPNGRIEGGILADQQCRKLRLEPVCFLGRRKVALRFAGSADGCDNASDQLVDALLATFCSQPTMKILGRDDAESGLQPAGGSENSFLLKDGIAFRVLDPGVTALPGDSIEGVNALRAQNSRDGEPRVGTV
jgi:hypothetical protein